VEGLGQRSAQFSSPDFPAGTLDQSSLHGIEEDNPYVTGPAIGGFPDTSTVAGTGAVHVATGASPSGNLAGRAQHWSNLFDWKSGPLFWMMLATILYFGLISARVGARVSIR
jgi:hypothetical protein